MTTSTASGLIASTVVVVVLVIALAIWMAGVLEMALQDPTQRGHAQQKNLSLALDTKGMAPLVYADALRVRFGVQDTGVRSGSTPLPGAGAAFHFVWPTQAHIA